MAKEIKHFANEADIGSGEQNAEQREIEREVASIQVPERGSGCDGRHVMDVIEEQEYADQHATLSGHNLQDVERERKVVSASERRQEQDAERVLQHGTHIARITTAQLPDGTYEAQVYVRLAREPEVAETYIPAGAHPSEAEAWAAAEERAKRALNNHEF